jgi:hypothetical protein
MRVFHGNQVSFREVFDLGLALLKFVVNKVRYCLILKINVLLLFATDQPSKVQNKNFGGDQCEVKP